MTPVYRVRRYRAYRSAGFWAVRIAAAAILTWLFVCCWLAMGQEAPKAVYPAKETAPVIAWGPDLTTVGTAPFAMNA